MKLPTEDRHLKTRAQFLADLAMMMGGYASEKLIFGDVSTGASSDLKQASELARQLVMKYGMSDLGPITFGKNEEMLFLGRDIAAVAGLFRKGCGGHRCSGAQFSDASLWNRGENIEDP